MRIHHKEKLMLSRTGTVRTRKKAANLSVDGELLDSAKRLKLNLSKVFEAGLSAAIREKQREQWLSKNRAALEAYNEHIERDGVFSDGMRSF
jgi:antitoxin CcdA